MFRASFFQRLRRISQTGLLSLVFQELHIPDFIMLWCNASDVYSIRNFETEKCKNFREEEKSAMLAILLHDVGHGAVFSRFRKSFDGRLASRETFDLLMKKINEEFNGELSMVLEMFQGKYHRKFFNQLISSQLDVDRLDYLKRDSFFYRCF